MCGVTANVISDKYAANMVMKQLHKYPPSWYVPGEIVYVKRRRGHKINTSKFFEGIVLTANYAKHMYKVKHDNGIGWFRVSHMAAKTRQAELAMRKLNVPRQRISLRCHCECDTCHKSADLLCSNVISRSCCRISKQKCCLPKHEQHGLSVKDFEKPKNAVTDFIDYIHIISPMPDENEEATRDLLMANALAVDLIPEGNVPRDGNCMFHAVAHGLSVNGNSVNQEEVRNAAAKWLEDNQLINGDVHLPDFLYGMGWEQYLNGLRGAEWGDQLALIGIANGFGVAIGIVSSIHVDSSIQYIYPQNNIVGQPCIFLGHEFETHYIRLVPLYETVPMLQSDQQTVEDQGGAGYAKLNSDIRDASEDDQPCADNVGTANEKQSADSFGESVDDQQCAGNRRKADENEQSACGICHVVDDLQSEYSDHRSEDSRRATGDHRSEDYRGAADDHRSEDNRGAADDHRSEDSHGVADDLRSEYSRGAADDHRSEDSRGVADDHRSEDSRGAADDHRAAYNRGVADDHRSEDSRGAADDDQQSVDVRNEECGNRQLAYCTRPSNICDLPDEILHLIFEHVASGGGTNIGLMRNTWTHSLRVQCLLNDVTQPMVHIGEDIMRCLGGHHLFGVGLSIVSPYVS